MELTVYIDFKSPAARLALGPTRKLAAELGVDIDWRPYNVQRRMRSTKGSAKGAVHARVRNEYRAWEQAFYAEQQGIRLKQPTEPLDGFVANAGLLWALSQERADAYVDDVFERVWAGELDPSSAEEVAAALDRAGCATDGFAAYLADDAEAALAAHVDQALELRAVDVPAYLVADDVYVGREHLPMIRWLLEGQVGEPPV